MDWLLIIILLIAIYGVIAWYIHRKNLFPDHVVFYGPIMAVKSRRVGFLDWFRHFSTFFRVYASFGVLMVVIISVGITVLLLVSVHLTLIFQPEPTGIYAPRNILLLPGVNEYVPSTFAVWFAFVLAIAIHELGHGILSRIEDIKVKGMGALLFVIPIGFFVEPDEEELEKKKGMPKIRMFGAGITNNIVIGVVCFLVMILLAGMAVPSSQPVIQGVYQNYSAQQAGIPAYSVITGINGVPVATIDQVSALLNQTSPGDTIALTVRNQETVSTYNLTLTAWPGELGERQSGFMGVYYYSGSAVIGAVQNSASPLGFLMLLTVPFNMSADGQFLRILAFDTPATEFYSVPFDQFWVLVNVLFWSGWININLGIFNAIPMVPLDGGYILKEGVERVLDRKGLIRYAQPIVSVISTFMIVMLISLVALPYLLHL